MIKRRLLIALAGAALLSTASVSMQWANADEEEGIGSKVVGSDEECPSGMVVSGMTGGEGDITKVCIKPNTATMPDDSEPTP